MNNLARAAGILDRLYATGCRELVVCGGSRNAPLVAAAAARDRMKSWNFFEERSAAFFALGRARATGAPIAVITTSGTAAAELLPAAIEAHYSGVPLVLVTADRPIRHRGTGAPQSIEQAGLFGPYALFSEPGEPEAWRRDGPLHINVPFDEPLLDGEIPPPAELPAIDQMPGDMLDPGAAAKRVREFLREFRRRLLILGPLEASERDATRELASRCGAPIIAEPLSGLREDGALADLVLRAGERSVRDAPFDAVLRIGGVPTTRLWRDLDETLSVPVLSCSRLPFSGLARGEHLRCALEETLADVEVVPREQGDVLRRDRELVAKIAELLDREPDSEPALFRSLSRVVPEDAFVFLGNSLPIREWDLFAGTSRRYAYGGNRGANGIDGEVSTFLGMCTEKRENWCVVGDLTALYDLSALWAAPQLPSMKIRIVVINNGGGRIFGRVPSLGAVEPAERERLFENPHAIRFQPWASMWGFDHVTGDAVSQTLPDHVVIEVRPDVLASARAWKSIDELA